MDWLKDNAIDIFLWILLWLVAIILAILLVAFARAEKLCLEHGWKDSKVTWGLTAYCIREENEYEIVKPLKVILAEKGD